MPELYAYSAELVSLYRVFTPSKASLVYQVWQFNFHHVLDLLDGLFEAGLGGTRDM